MYSTQDVGFSVADRVDSSAMMAIRRTYGWYPSNHQQGQDGIRVGAEVFTDDIVDYLGMPNIPNRSGIMRRKEVRANNAIRKGHINPNSDRAYWLKSQLVKTPGGSDVRRHPQYRNALKPVEKRDRHFNQSSLATNEPNSDYFFRLAQRGTELRRATLEEAISLEGIVGEEDFTDDISAQIDLENPYVEDADEEYISPEERELIAFCESCYWR